MKRDFSDSSYALFDDLGHNEKPIANVRSTLLQRFSFVRFGHLVGAQALPLRRFSDFPNYAQTHLNPTETQQVAMYCTGGIRCEKASSYLLGMGFRDVYQLRGGILNYLTQVPAASSRWRGECFVFDERIALDAALRPGHYQRCCGHCRRPLTAADLAASGDDISSGCCYCKRVSAA